MKILWELFYVFAKIGMFTFGGGYAMIGIIEYNCVEKKKWITGDEMMDITVIAESTPGPIAINAATFIGYKQAGFAGAVSATLGIVLPSFVIIYTIAMFLDNFLEITWIANAFKGIKIAVGLLILDAGFTMKKKMHNKRKAKMFMAAAFCIMLCVNVFALNFSSISLMLCAAFVSLAMFIWKEQKMKKGGAK